MHSKRTRWLIGLFAACTMLLFMSSSTLAANTVVTPSNPGGWGAGEVRSNATVSITATQPRSGKGSLQFTTHTVINGQDKADYEKSWDGAAFPNRTLGNLDGLSYEVYRDSSSTTAAHFAPVLRLYVYNPTVAKYAILIWEPVYNGYSGGFPTDAWQSRNILGGYFWMYVPSGQSIPSGVVQNFNSKLADWIAGTPTGQPGDPAPVPLDGNSLIFRINVGVGSGWGSDFTGFVDNVYAAWGADAESANFEPDTCTAVCYADAVNGNDANSGASVAQAKKTIQAAIDAVDAGGEVHVLPGTYSETAAGRTLTSIGGTYTFGLFVPDAKSGISIIGVDASDTPITDAGSVAATINTNATNDFGPSGVFVEGDNVTIQGVRIGTNSAGQNKTLEVIGDAFTLKDSDVADPGGSLYINDFRFDTGGNTSHVQSYTVADNTFADGMSIDLASGAGFSGPVSGRQITGNTFQMLDPSEYWPSISFNGSGTGVPWFTDSVGGAVIKNNTFTNSSPDGQFIRARGTYDNSQFDWKSYFYDNTFNKAAIITPTTLPDVRTFSYTSGSYTFNDVRRIGAVIQPEVDNALDGDTILVKQGTYPEQVVVSKSLTLTGVDGKADTFIVQPDTLIENGPSPAGLKVRSLVTFNNGKTSSMSGFTVAGPMDAPESCATLATGVYVHQNATLTLTDSIVKNVYLLPSPALFGCQAGLGIRVGEYGGGTPGHASITGVEVTGYQKGGIVVTAAGSTATLDGNTVTGVGNSPYIAQNGIQVSSGAVADVKNNTVTQNHCILSGVCGADPLTQTQSSGILVFNPGAGTTVKNNLVSNNDNGIYHYFAGGGITIEGNVITSNSYEGVFLDEGDAVVTDNMIVGANYGVAAVAFGPDYNTGDSKGTLTYNQIDAANISGIALLDDDTGDANTPFIKANRNNITGNVFGFNNPFDETMDGTCNWWGAANGPSGVGPGSGDKVSDHVTFSPWLTTSDLRNGPCDGVPSGSLEVTKVVAGDPAPAQTFHICIADGLCHDFNGAGSYTFTNLPVGSYTVTESDPGADWSVSGSGAVVQVGTNQTASATITNTYTQPKGSLEVTKVVAGDAAPSQTFHICIADGKCHDFNGAGSYTFTDLPVGSYTVTESDPGADWSVSGSGAVVQVVKNQTASATITNTYTQPKGSLEVTKVVADDAAPAQTFHICIADGKCHDFNGAGSYTFTDLPPGSYTVTESDPGADWSVSGSGAVVQVVKGQTAKATITNTYKQPVGSITVTKIVEGGAPALTTFQICVADGVCHNFLAGESYTFTNLPPGSYTVKEEDLGDAWEVTGSPQTVGVLADSETKATVTNRLRRGSVTVTKIVEGDAPALTTFTICLSNSFCHDFLAGESYTFTNLLPGSYTLKEEDLGDAWEVTGSPQQVVVMGDSETKVTVTNRLRLGSLTVTKVVNGDAAPAQTFHICLAETVFCHDYNGAGSYTFTNLLPGTYTVTESDPGANWTVLGSGAKVEVKPDATATATITNTYAQPKGSLSVTKVVNGDPAPAQSFIICIADSVCHTFQAGETYTWSDLPVGKYTINEANPGANWTVSGSGAEVQVTEGQTATATVTNTYHIPRGSLTVTKVVNGDSAPAQTFTICIADGVCHDYNGAGSYTFTDLQPGTYTVTESDPGANWTVSGSGAHVEVKDGQTATATVTNTYRIPRGSLTVTKVVNGDPAPAQTFTICIADGVCHDYNGAGSYTFTDLQPGTYTVTESDPGANWTVAGSGAQVQVASNQTATATITNTYHKSTECPKVTLPQTRAWSSGDQDVITLVSGGPVSYSWEGEFPTDKYRVFGSGSGVLQDGQSFTIPYPPLDQWGPADKYGTHEGHVTIHFNGSCGYFGWDWDRWYQDHPPTGNPPPAQSKQQPPATEEPPTEAAPPPQEQPPPTQEVSAPPPAEAAPPPQEPPPTQEVSAPPAENPPQEQPPPPPDPTDQPDGSS
jgi:parallel beta-helix repeat protein